MKRLSRWLGVWVLTIGVCACKLGVNDEAVLPKVDQLLGSWEITKVVNFKLPKGKSASTNTSLADNKEHIMIIKPGGLVEFRYIRFTLDGMSSSSTFILNGTYTLDKDILRMTYSGSSNVEVVNFFKVLSWDSNKLELFQDKELFIRSIEENKDIMSFSAYSDGVLSLDAHERFESSASFFK